MTDETMTTAERRAVRSTYRSLRLGVVAMILLLTVAVVAEAARAGCWLDSLSAYYWTGAHDALVGSLCAVGVLLVVYTGTDDVEDALLDAAGFLAFVVALTPTEVGIGCGDVPVAVPAALADARASLSALVVVALLAVVGRTVVVLRARAATATALARVALVLVVLVPAVGLVVAPARVVAGAHDAAAVLLFVAVVAVVVLRAFAARDRASRWAVAYALLGGAMLLTLSVVVALHATVPTWTHAVLVLEAALVALFGAFWVFQTVELWGVDVARRRPRPVAAP